MTEELDKITYQYALGILTKIAESIYQNRLPRIGDLWRSCTPLELISVANLKCKRATEILEKIKADGWTDFLTHHLTDELVDITNYWVFVFAKALENNPNVIDTFKVET